MWRRPDLHHRPGDYASLPCRRATPPSDPRGRREIARTRCINRRIAAADEAAAQHAQAVIEYTPQACPGAGKAGASSPDIRTNLPGGVRLPPAAIAGAQLDRASGEQAASGGVIEPIHLAQVDLLRGMARRGPTITRRRAGSTSTTVPAARLRPAQQRRAACPAPRYTPPARRHPAMPAPGHPGLTMSPGSPRIRAQSHHRIDIVTGRRRNSRCPGCPASPPPAGRDSARPRRELPHACPASRPARK